MKLQATIRRNWICLLLALMFWSHGTAARAVDSRYLLNVAPGAFGQALPPPAQTRATGLIVAPPETGPGMLAEDPKPAITPGDSLSLARCAQMAAGIHKDIRRADLELQIADQKIHEASTARLPRIYLSTLFKDSNFSERLEPLGNIGELISDVAANSAWSAGMVMEMPIYHGGKLHTLEQMAATGKKAARLQRMQAVQDVLLQVADAYLNILVLENDVKLQDRKLESKALEVATTRQKVRSQEALRQQVLALELEADEIRQDRLKALNAKVLARARLSKLLGLSITEGWSLRPQVQLSELRENLQDFLARVKKGNLKLKLLAEQINQARHEVAVAHAAEEPQINLKWDWMHNHPFERPENATDAWNFYVVANYDIFDGGRAVARKRGRRKQVDQAKLGLERAWEEVEIGTIQAYNAYVETAKLIRLVDKNIELAHENLRFVQEKYDARILLRNDLIQGQVKLLQAQQNRFTLLAALLRARARLFHLAGELTLDKFGS